MFASATLFLVGGCSHEPGIKTSVSQLEKAFPATATPGQTERTIRGQAPDADAGAYVHVALDAVRSNDYASAVVLLDAAVRTPGMTPDQFLVVQQAKTALVTDLQNRAVNGDANAQTALKSIEQSRLR